jgi:response regulator RpfG family c-di-GMP phosphodiesterase
VPYANELYFAIVATILWGIVVIGKPLVNQNKLFQPESYWFLALILTASSFTIFAIASTLFIGLLVLANTLFIAGYIYFSAYCRFLNQPLTKHFKKFIPLALLLFALVYQSMLQWGTFAQRVCLIDVLVSFFILWQLFELRQLQKKQVAIPFFLTFTVITELTLSMLRMIVLLGGDTPINTHIYQEPFLSALVRWFWTAFTVLSYIALIGHKIKSVSSDFIQVQLHNNLMKIELANKKAEQSELQLLASLISLAKARDNETGNHITRTQKYVRVLAMRLRSDGHYTESLSDESVDLLFKVAPLHDIGKIGIPDKILLKNGPLTDEEWVIMKTHTLIGESVLNASGIELDSNHDLIAKAIKVAGGHHEKWDSTGYPRGLRGAAIPLEARIMSLADMYDALISERVYKKAWTHEQSVQEINSKRGTNFDPLIVDAFIAEQDSFREIAQLHRDS